MIEIDSTDEELQELWWDICELLEKAGYSEKDIRKARQIVESGWKSRRP
jgi:hypothetical protein